MVPPPIACRQHPFPIQVAIVSVGMEQLDGPKTKEILAKIGLDDCLSLDFREDFRGVEELVDSCTDHDGNQKEVQQAIIGHADFVRAMVTCIKQSSSIPANRSRVVFRVCRKGVKSTVVSRAEEEALNQLAHIGDGDAKAINAKHFTLVDKNVEEVEAELALAVQWAGWAFGEPKVLHSLPQERRYGYASTEQDDANVNAAIETTKANWEQWQNIARQSTVNVNLPATGSNASMPPTVESLSVVCPSPLLSPRGRVGTIRFACVKAPSFDIREMPAGEDVAPVVQKKTPIAKKQTWQPSGQSWDTWSGWSWSSGQWGRSQWYPHGWSSSSSTAWAHTDDRAPTWEQRRPNFPSPAVLDMSIVERTRVNPEPTQGPFHCWACTEIADWDWHMQNVMGIDECARLQFHTLAQQSDHHHRMAIAILSKCLKKMSSGKSAESPSAFVMSCCLHAMPDNRPKKGGK